MMVGIFPRKKIEPQQQTSVFEDLGERKKPTFGERLRSKARAGFKKTGERIRKRIAEDQKERKILRGIERESRFEERKRLAKVRGKAAAKPAFGNLDFFGSAPKPRFSRKKGPRRRDDMGFF